MEGHVACKRKMRRAYKILVGKPEGRPRCRWDDIKMRLAGRGLEGVNCIHLAQYKGQWQAFVSMVMSLRAP
jgi:hypothetical protein